MGCQFGVPGGRYPPKKYPSAPPPGVYYTFLALVTHSEVMVAYTVIDLTQSNLHVRPPIQKTKFSQSKPYSWNL